MAAVAVRREGEWDALAGVLPFDARERLSNCLTTSPGSSIASGTAWALTPWGRAAPTSDLVPGGGRLPFRWPAPENLALAFVGSSLLNPGPARGRPEPQHAAGYRRRAART